MGDLVNQNFRKESSRDESLLTSPDLSLNASFGVSSEVLDGGASICPVVCKDKKPKKRGDTPLCQRDFLDHVNSILGLLIYEAAEKEREDPM